MSYEFKTTPFDHQRRVFDETRDMDDYAILWEQGTGKTKLMLDNAAYLYEKDDIDAVLVVAPGSVHLNWVANEIPAHLPERVAVTTMTHAYQASKAVNKDHKSQCDMLLKHRGLSILCMSYSGFTTKAGSELAKAFLKKRKVFYVIDEAHYIKTPSAKRSRWIISSGRHAVRRRALTGTPIANSPFDAYCLVKFLLPDFWKQQGMASFSAFKTFFGVFEKNFNGSTGREFETLVCYRNLDKLQEILASISSRVLKEDVLDLPPKLYSKLYYEITPEQKKLYKELKDEFMVELATGEISTASLAIVRLLRFQQILCGYLPTDIDAEGSREPAYEIPGGNPKLSTLVEFLDGLGHQAIIWCRFQKDIDLIMEALGDCAVQYDGRTKEDDRMPAIARFQNGEVDFFVVNTAAGCEGLNLTAARTEVYYSSSFNLVQRLQSEDRAHRHGQKYPVNIVDLVCKGSVEDRILDSTRDKHDLACMITGDNVKEWI